MDLLRWFRFLWALGVEWDQATRAEARDFCRWLQVATKPVRRHWRSPAGAPPSDGGAPAPAATNAVTGKPARGQRYEPSTAAHCESVLRGFYDFHLEAGSGPMLNPFPLTRHRRSGRANAHHNPMEPFVGQRSGRYRPKVVTRVPRSIPDERFDELFAQLGSHRDRALIPFRDPDMTIDDFDNDGSSKLTGVDLARVVASVTLGDGEEIERVRRVYQENP